MCIYRTIFRDNFDICEQILLTEIPELVGRIAGAAGIYPFHCGGYFWNNKFQYIMTEKMLQNLTLLLMVRKLITGVKWFDASLTWTLVRSLSCVSIHVHFQLGPCYESSSTDFTRKLAFDVMGFQVILKRKFGFEYFLTFATRINNCAVLIINMSLQILFSFEVLSTFLAYKRSLITMHSSCVVIKTCLGCENWLTLIAFISYSQVSTVNVWL